MFVLCTYVHSYVIMYVDPEQESYSTASTKPEEFNTGLQHSNDSTGTQL